jgi:hypothetical protein
VAALRDAVLVVTRLVRVVVLSIKQDDNPTDIAEFGGGGPLHGGAAGGGCGRFAA